MSKFTRVIKSVVGGALGEQRRLAIREAGRRYWECREILSGARESQKRPLTDPRLVASRHRIGEYANKHKGERCFIVGNGPSLNKTDLSLLKNEVWFGMNRIYLMAPELGFEPTYYVCINGLVLEQCARDIAALTMPRFLSVRVDDGMGLPDDAIYLNTIGGRARFAYDPAWGVWESGTVTYVAMQLAFYMGFKTVVLIGVDHRFSTKGPENTTVVSAGDDPDHFSSEYFGKGFKWQLPDLVSSEKGYRLARAAFEGEDRCILDGTIDGHLTIYPKVDYASLFEGAQS